MVSHELRTPLNAISGWVRMLREGGLPIEKRERALEIIDSGRDADMCARLGMRTADLAKRRKMLAELRARLAMPLAARARQILKKPQPFLMEIGDALIYPTCFGACINPYFPSKERQTYWTGHESAPWKQTDWSAFVVVDRGRAFDLLAWYTPLTLCAAIAEAPTPAGLRGELLWKLERAGTCSAVQFKRMELDRIGAFCIDPDKLRGAFPDMRPGTRQAIADISIANALGARRPSRTDRTIAAIEHILK
jgi:hypothetical protein